MLKINEENGLYIEANADVFVVPNRACLGEQFSDFIKNDRIEGGRRFCKNNNLDFDPDKDKFIQVWITSEDLNQDNLGSHGFMIKNNNERLFCSSMYFEYIPENLIRDMKEGDEKTLLYKNIELETRKHSCLHEKNPKIFKADLVLTLKANQRNYRYRDFGNFEDAMKSIL